MNAQLQFVNAWVLYCLWLVPLIAWWWYASARRMENRLTSFMSLEMQKKLGPGGSRTRHSWQTGLLTAALFLLLMAAARPQWGTREDKVYQRGRDLVIALDVSRSMLANDVHPNRLLRAKTDIMDIIKELRGDRAALLAFRKKAVTLCPLTTDYAYLRQSLEAVSIDSAPAGETDLGDAITKAIETLRNDEGSHKAIILISDGEDLSGKALAAAEQAGKLNIPIFTVGLGSSSGSRIPEEEKAKTFFKHKGTDVVTKLNDQTMHAIAEATRGAYIPVGTASMTSTTLGTLYRDHLSRLTAMDQEETLQRRTVERFQLFLLPAFLLMLCATFLSRGRIAASALQPVEEPSQPKFTLKDLNPPQKPLKDLTLLFVTFSSLILTTGAQTTSIPETVAADVPSTASTNAKPVIDIPPGREGARLAQKYYLMGKYTEAADAYLEALRSVPDQSQQDFRYNAAVSLYTGRKFKEAAGIFKDLFQQGKAGQTDYAQGLGAALFRASESIVEGSNMTERATLLKESGEAFKEAVRSQPGSTQPRKNLAVVLEALPAIQEQARTAELMATYAQVQAPQLAEQMLQAQRQIVADIPPAFTNDSPAQIKTLEVLAEKEKNNADLWLPLKGKLLNSMSQQQAGDPKIQQQVQAFEQLVEATRTHMRVASAALRDLDTAGYNSAVTAETGIYQFWKSIAAYQGLLQEDIRRQTNAISMTTIAKQPSTDQLKFMKSEEDEAINLTDLFTKRFSESVPESGTPPKPKPPPAKDGTKGPEGINDEDDDKGISAETRRKIVELAGQASRIQKTASSLLEKKELTASLTEQRKTHNILKEIEKLLPKEKSSSQQQQQKNQDQKDQQKQQDQKQNDRKKQQDEPQPQPKDEKKDKPPEQKEEKQDKKNKEELTQDQLKKMLEKAAQREVEHEMQKRERNRSIPLSPIDRDW